VRNSVRNTKRQPKIPNSKFTFDSEQPLFAASANRAPRMPDSAAAPERLRIYPHHRGIARDSRSRAGPRAVTRNATLACCAHLHPQRHSRCRVASSEIYPLHPPIHPSSEASARDRSRVLARDDESETRPKATVAGISRPRARVNGLISRSSGSPARAVAPNRESSRARRTAVSDCAAAEKRGNRSRRRMKRPNRENSGTVDGNNWSLRVVIVARDRSQRAERYLHAANCKGEGNCKRCGGK